jgi:hypothetical protein
MHDPMTVAHELHLPILGEVTIWHVDPEADGSDDSCDWHGLRKTRANGWYPAQLDDYKRMTPETKAAVDFVWFNWTRQLSPRPWWKHPRWHIRHWKIQISAWQALNRWLWSRCAGCGKRFRWGYSPVSNSWNSGGPRWGKGESGVFHWDCRDASLPAAPGKEPARA